MKKLISTFLQSTKICWLFIFNSTLPMASFSQDDYGCGTTASVGTIGSLSSIFGTTSSPNGPYYIRIYIHAIRTPEGTGGQTNESIETMVDILNTDFNPHNIFFIWDCNIYDIPAPDDATYFDPYAYDIYWQNPAYRHTDGMDIFLGPEEADASGFGSYDGIGEGIPGTALWVTGKRGSATNSIETKLVSHEMGHCLGLYHTFKGTFEQGGPNSCCELVNGSNGLICGDFVEDTDADPHYYWSTFPTCNDYWNLYYGSFISFCFSPANNPLVDINGDPYAPLKDNLMSYNRIESCINGFSVGQGERMRQIISISPVLQACIVSGLTPSLTIATNTTWTTSNTPNNGEINILGDLVIESGATLTISSGVTVRFPEDGKLIIKPDAILNLEGTLTDGSCGSGVGWSGVEVWGNSSQSQYSLNSPSAQGTFRGKNGAVIENAETAIKSYGPSYALHAGGKVYCKGTTFLNNTVGVDIAPFQNFWPYPVGGQGQPRNYFSSFSGCTFEVDTEYPHTTGFRVFLKMVGVEGIDIAACSFINNMELDVSDPALDYDDYGYGIIAEDAGFSVTESCIGNTSPCEDYAYSKFENLGYGIYASRVVTNQPYLVRVCEFANCFIGIRSHGVSGASAILNYFGMGLSPSGSQTKVQAGIVFESGITGLICEENAFEHLAENYEFPSFGTVSDNTGETNKKIRRNTFYQLAVSNQAQRQNAAPQPNINIRGLTYECNSVHNTNVSYNFNVPNGWIKVKQGLEESAPGGGVAYRSAANRFAYSGWDFSNYGTAAIDYYYNDQSFNHEPLTYVGVNKILVEPNECPSEYCEPFCGEDGGGDEYAAAVTEFYEKQEEYNTLKADYETEPNDGKAARLGYLRSVMDKNANNIIRYQLYDTLMFDPDSLFHWIKNVHSVEGDFWLVGEHLASGDTAGAQTILNQIPNRFELSESQLEDWNNYKAIVNIIADAPIYALDNDKLTSIQGYDTAEGFAGGWARRILTLYGAHYPPDIILPDNGFGEKIIPSGTKKEWKNTTAELVSAKPNPAKDFVVFNFDKSIASNDKSLVIKDLNGRTAAIFQNLIDSGSFKWDTKHLPNGIYLYQLLESGAIIGVGKIIVEK